MDGFRVVLDPLAEHLRDGRRPRRLVVTAVGSRVTGVQAGLILAYLASRVLGEYLFLPPDPSAPNGVAPAGRLTLVAPNIVMVERTRRQPARLPPLGVPRPGDAPDPVHL